MIDTIPDRIVAKDINGQFIICNKAMARYLGKENPEDIIGKNIIDFRPFEISKKILDDEKVFLKSGESQLVYEEYKEDSSGKREWSMIKKVPFYDIHKNLIGIVSVGRDITDRKITEIEIRRKNEQLRESNAEKDKLFSIIGHDLRSSFTNFLGLTQIMTEELYTLSYPDIKKIAESMRTSANNLYDLLGNLLEWAKIQRGMEEPDPKHIKLSKEVSDCVKLIAAPAGIKDVSIIINIPEDIEVFTDTNMFDTIIRNLVSNAIKFTPGGGKITISALYVSNDNVEITISDTGIGMNSVQINKLFRINEQENRKGTDGEPSTGLGLILCKEIVGKLGGNINVESVVGEGTVFCVHLPAGK